MTIVAVPTAENEYDLAILGAGFAGLYLAYRAAGLGLCIKGFEAAPEVGGTWFWNRYPGARCDTESLEYSYWFSEEVAREWNWSQRYAEQPEILSYIQYVARKYDLEKHFLFNTRVTRQVWREDISRWEIHSDDGQVTLARFSALAPGNLTLPKSPDIPGIENFKGDIYHSARWPEPEPSFVGKRVALIGTGSTGIQLVPQLAERAELLTVLQRTANYIVPGGDRIVPEERVQSYRDSTAAFRELAFDHPGGMYHPPVPTVNPLTLKAEVREKIMEDAWKLGGSLGFMSAFSDLMVSEEANRVVADFVRKKIGETVLDPVKAEILKPKVSMPIGTKRVGVGINYYETYNRDNVNIVDIKSDPIVEIMPNGVQLQSGLLEADVLVFATGFDAVTGAILDIELQGRQGKLLTEAWADGVKTYLGFASHGFPNLFFVAGPQSPAAKTNVVTTIEQCVDWLCDCLGYLRANDIVRMEATAEAEDAWDRQLADIAADSLYPRTDSWFNGANVAGKPKKFLMYLGGLGNYRKACEASARDGYAGFALTKGETALSQPAAKRVGAL